MKINVLSTKNTISKCSHILNIHFNTNIYTESHLIELLNSTDINKIDTILNIIQKNDLGLEIPTLLYELEGVNLNLLDIKYFKIKDLDFIIKNIKKFSTARIIEIFNYFIIQNEEKLRSYFASNWFNSSFKLKITKEPILYDFLTGIGIIDKKSNYKSSKQLPETLLTFINNDYLCEDVNFINDTIDSIREGNFICPSNFIGKLNTILNVKTSKLILKEQQLCEIICGLKRNIVNNDIFIDRLNYHGFIFAMGIMKEQFNIDCYSGYYYGFNKKIIQEDNGKLFEYMLVNNKIDIKKLTEAFLYKILHENKINIINVIAKYKCNFNDTITNMLTENLKSWRNRRYSLLNNHNKTRFLEILGLCEKMGYIVNEDVFLHILKFFSDDKIIEYIDKWNLEIKDIIHIFVINKQWSVISKIVNDNKYNFSYETYINCIYETLGKVKTKVSIDTYLEIYNYCITNYKIKPQKSLKSVAFFALNLNFIKKLVQKYNFKYTLSDIEVHYDAPINSILPNFCTYKQFLIVLLQYFQKLQNLQPQFFQTGMTIARLENCLKTLLKIIIQFHIYFLIDLVIY